jgi:hypothetical protein
MTVALPTVTVVPRSCCDMDVKNLSLLRIGTIRNCVTARPTHFGYRRAVLRSLQLDAIKKTAEKPDFL